MKEKMIIKTSSGKYQKRYSTQKQVSFFYYITQGYSKRQAAIRAGYSIHIANNPKMIMGTKTAAEYMHSFPDLFAKVGLDIDFMVNKFSEWFSAQDYAVQMAAYDRWSKIIQEAEKINSKKFCK